MADYDLVVIGSGPAGEKGAAQAAYFGKRVCLVERQPTLGGAASNTGTLPSKTLRETALYLSGYRQRGLHGVDLVQGVQGAGELGGHRTGDHLPAHRSGVLGERGDEGAGVELAEVDEEGLGGRVGHGSGLL